MFKKLFFLLAIATASAIAAPIAYYVNLNGPSESPTNASPGVGFARVIVDGVANTPVAVPTPWVSSVATAVGNNASITVGTIPTNFTPKK